jgi:hypothetical protein
MGRHCQERRAGKAAGLPGIRQAVDAGASDGGVGGDDSIHTVLPQQVGNRLNLRLVQVRSDFQRQRHVPAVAIGKPRLSAFETAKQRIECIVPLQFAQILRVRAGNIDRDVTGRVIDAIKAGQIVIGGLVDRGIEVLADVDAENSAAARELGGSDIGQQLVHAIVVEAHTIDDRLPLRNAEQARPGIPRLRTGGDGPYLDGAETKRCQRIDVVAVLVQTSRQTNRVGEAETHDLHRVGRHRTGQQAGGASTVEQADTGHSDPMRSFGIEGEEKAA